MTVGMYSAQFCEQGGIERVVRELDRIFALHNVSIWLVHELGDDMPCSGGSDCLPSDFEERRGFWARMLPAKKPDLMVFHHVADQYLDLVLQDIRLLREKGVKCAFMCHQSFPSPMLTEGVERSEDKILCLSQAAGCVLTVSRIDSIWWRALGCPALHVQNPFVHPSSPDASHTDKTLHSSTSTSDFDASYSVNLLWIGRNCEQKQPERAIEVMARVVNDAPNVHLTMIGGSDSGWKAIREQAARLGIADKVTCLGQQDDLNDLWDQADIHLLTSLTESFCLVLAEAKARGVPTAMFEIPFLELVESGKGLVTAPQGDVLGLAKEIVELAKNPEKRMRLGKEAAASLAPFNDDAVWQSWLSVFEALERKALPCCADENVTTIVTQEHFAWHQFCEKNLWAVQMVRDVSTITGGLLTMRTFAKEINALLRLAQKIKRMIRRT